MICGVPALVINNSYISELLIYDVINYIIYINTQWRNVAFPTINTQWTSLSISLIILVGLFSSWIDRFLETGPSKYTLVVTILTD